ncbi:MAG: xylulokinase [Burkholderiales bacterium]
MAFTLGIDLGTSAVKALLVDPAQTVVGLAEVPVPVCRPRPGWSEQSPEDWWDAVVSAIRGLRDASPASFDRVEAIGLSGQMHGAVLLDERGTVLRPAILWNDGRAIDACATLEQAVPELPRLAGVRAMPGFTAPKLLWVRDHEPDVFRRIAHVLLPKDYIRWRLTGELVTDASDAAGTLWLDQSSRAWSVPLLDATGLVRSQLPTVLEGSERGGTVRPDVAHALGLRDGVILAAGGGDAAAGAVGIGAVNEGDAFVSLGTSGQVFVVTRDYRPFPETMIHAFCHCVPDRWFQMAALLNGASCLAWVSRLVGQPDPGVLLDRVERATDGSDPLLFLPYLTGERTPHNDPHARGVFFGLDAGTTPEVLVRAVLEGVAFAVAEASDCVTRAGTRIERFAVIGGGSRSAFWMRLLASALARPVVRYVGAETGPAFGAARLARLALTGDSVSAICSAPAIRDVIDPDPALADRYRERAHRFRRLYLALAPEFRRAARDSSNT